MKRISIILCSAICIILVVVGILAKRNDNNYSENDKSYFVVIKSFTENGSYVEYPQIQGLSDKKKQKKINYILKEQVYLGAKTYMDEPFVDFSNPDYVYTFSIRVGLTNQDIASFRYYFDVYGEVHHEGGGVSRDTSRCYGVTIDMNIGEMIDLEDLMVVDERLIFSTDGIDEEPDYNGAIRPTFHRFQDAFQVYTSEEERDSFHIFSAQETIERLINPQGETNWYINENKQIKFYFDKDAVTIPYSELAEIIYPQYLEILSKE